VCDTYHDAIELYRTQGIHTVSIDEQTGIQALERIAADLLPRSGMLARREYEYIRHGTLGLFGNLHVATGEILSPLIRETRIEEDFLENIDGLVCTDADAHWRFVTDNLNTHASESLVRYVAAQCGIETHLGVKGRHGILRSLQSRRDFLTVNLRPNSTSDLRFKRYQLIHQPWFSLNGRFSVVENCTARTTWRIDWRWIKHWQYTTYEAAGTPSDASHRRWEFPAGPFAGI